MKNPRAFLMIGISLSVGLVAVVLASRWMSEHTTVLSSKVTVAAQDIDLGTPLTPQMLRVADWPQGSIPDGAVEDPKALDTRVVKTSLIRGEPVLESKLAPLGSTGGLSAVIAEGNRAMTVRVNDVIGVAGFALPGNYVDIIINTDDERAQSSSYNKSVSKIVLEHILVIAVAQEQSRDETKPKVVNAVTLEVTPEQAEKLDLARSVGSLSLVLRNQVDTRPVTTTGSTKLDLLIRPQLPEITPVKTEIKKVIVYRPEPVRNSGESVEVIRGTTRSVEEFKPE